MAASSNGESVSGRSERRTPGDEGLPLVPAAPAAGDAAPQAQSNATAPSYSRRRIVAEVVVVAGGGGVFGAAWLLGAEWFVRHFANVPPYVPTVTRGGLIAVGITLILIVRPLAGRWTERVGVLAALGACFRMGLALVLAVVASEVGLRVLDLPKHGEPNKHAASIRSEPSERYGWQFTASTSSTADLNGRSIRYDMNAEHNRAASVDDIPDPKLPTLLFAGESMMMGHGLNWEESLPGLVGKALNLQVVDVAVDGYATDQAFVRLIDALPRFEHPVAIITLFIPLMVERIAHVDHPRLVFDGVNVRQVPPSFVQNLRMTKVFSEATEFRPEWAIDTAREVFRQTARLAKEKNARAIFVTPYFWTDWPRSDQYLIDELLVREGLTVVNPNYHYEPIPGDNHPTAASTRRFADAVIAELRTELASREPVPAR